MALHPPQWYDRHLKPIQGHYEGLNKAPHANILRTTYRVPFGKEFLLQSAYVVLYRVTAATAVHIVTCSIGAIEDVFISAVLRTNNVGDRAEMTLGDSVLLQQRDILDISTQDLSTGGTIDYFAAFYGVEFDSYQRVPIEPRIPDVQEPKREPSIVEWVKDVFMPKPVM